MKSQKSDLFEIEKIMGKKVEKNSIYFLVKWKGYPNKENTWEPIEHFMNLKFLLEKVEEFDHNLNRISNKHKKVIEYRENMSIEEESDEERDSQGRVKKFVKRQSKRRQSLSRSKRKVRAKMSRNVKNTLNRPSLNSKKSEKKTKQMMDEDYYPEMDLENSNYDLLNKRHIRKAKHKMKMVPSKKRKQKERENEMIEKRYIREEKSRNFKGHNGKYSRQDLYERKRVKDYQDYEMEEDEYDQDYELPKRVYKWNNKTNIIEFEE
jgi:hypothetical protein